MDSILNLFPSGGEGDAGVAMSGWRPGTDLELPSDPLFGLMAMPFDFDEPPMVL